jgi:hypothetical protein
MRKRTLGTVTALFIVGAPMAYAQGGPPVPARRLTTDG